MDVSRRQILVLAMLPLSVALVLGLPGCGYSFRPPYDPNIRTVYLPVFKSYRFREDLNIQLTEMLKNEINLRTPYIVVGDPEKADARLEGTVTFDDKNVLVENPYNLPRHVLGTMTVTVSYTDNRSGRTRSLTQPAPFPQAAVAESAPFYPEIGETAMVGFHKVMEKIVRDIVTMMEEPWGPEYIKRDEDRLLEESRFPEEEEEDEPGRVIVREDEAARIPR